MQAPRVFLLVLFSAMFLASCIKQESKFSDEKMEAQAQKIVGMLDSNSVDIFRVWNFTSRGKFGFWSRDSAGWPAYTCWYGKVNDTAFLDFTKPHHLLHDFPSNYVFDTSKFWKFKLWNYKNRIYIEGTDRFGANHSIAANLHADSLFPSSDPFAELGSLTETKNKLDVFGISYNKGIGDFIQFYLSAQHVLTYLPDDPNLNPKFSERWRQEFARGKTIKKNWNFRKLEQPLDGG